jgi:GNAT superfamily N-acetyltransferase
MDSTHILHAAWTGIRVARPTRDLARATTFYRDLLGLPMRGGFRNHDGYDGMFFVLPGGAELEITAGPHPPRPGTAEDLLILYLASRRHVDTVANQLVDADIPSVTAANPYWNRWGRTFLDPDGFRVVIAARDPPTDPITIDWHDGPRAELRELFELAEDSAVQLDQYIDAGDVLVARRGAAPIGHLQLVPNRDGAIEIKSMAVRSELHRTGVGRVLVEEATRRCAARGWTQMVVATAAADIGNLRFYQRVGFRMQAIERDAFTATTGYPDQIVLDGIELLDRVWLSARLAT